MSWVRPSVTVPNLPTQTTAKAPSLAGLPTASRRQGRRGSHPTRRGPALRSSRPSPDARRRVGPPTGAAECGLNLSVAAKVRRPSDTNARPYLIAVMQRGDASSIGATRDGSGLTVCH
jgi:hypothetical protein